MIILPWDEFYDADGQSRPLLREKTAMTAGVFDGVHRGHQALLRKIVSSGYDPVVVTFRNHPRSVLAPGNAPGLLITVEERLKIFEKEGVRAVILIDFSKRFSILTGEAFLYVLWRNASLAYMAIGPTFRCGHRGAEDAAAVVRFNAARGVRTEIVEPVRERGLAISSSRIREALAAGDTALAECMLGRKLK
jgi:FAD synthase